MSEDVSPATNAAQSLPPGLSAEHAARLARLIAADPHAPGSVDAVLLAGQVWLTSTSQAALYRKPDPQARPPLGCRPDLGAIVAEQLAPCVHDFERAVALRRWVAALRKHVRAARDSSGVEERYRPLSPVSGGTEEAIVARGGPLAADLGRVLVALARVAGLPARLVYLYNLDAEARHTVVEVFVAGRWSVLDPVSDRSFVWTKHGYASAWEIRGMPVLVDRLQDHDRLRYVDSGYYRVTAIAAYDPAAPGWDYAEQPVDAATSARLRAGESS